jgi:hypothetical protein
MTGERLALYYEGGTRDRHWVAPAGLGIVEAKRQRVSKSYKTRWGAQQALARAYAEQRRAEGSGGDEAA